MSALVAMGATILLYPCFLALLFLLMWRRDFMVCLLDGFHNLPIQSHYFPTLGKNMVIHTTKRTWFSIP
jgi:hypothetical protein